MIAVTGATGFVGRRLVAALRADGVPVRVVARDPRRAPADAEVATCDLTDGVPPSVFAGCDVVVHAAAFVPPDLRDPAHAAECLAVNALGTLRVAAAAADVGARLVVVSSGNVYAPRREPADEDAPVWPVHRATYYLASKVTAECYALHRAPGCTVVRLSSVYGPGMRGGVVATFRAELAAGRPIRASSGPYRVDLVHVDDVVAGIRASVATPGCGSVVNLGSGEATAMDTLGHAMAAAFGRPDLVTVAPQGTDDPGFAPLDVRRARERLGYRPRSLEDGLRRWIDLGDT